MKHGTSVHTRKYCASTFCPYGTGPLIGGGWAEACGEWSVSGLAAPEMKLFQGPAMLDLELQTRIIVINR